MGLSIYNIRGTGPHRNTSYKGTALGKNNGFVIDLFQNDFYNANFQSFWKFPKITGFKGIMLENISLDFSTPWSDAGGAQIGKKIAGYVNSKFIKAFASINKDQGFQPFICSDAWTQQKVAGDASPLKMTLKFRAFNEEVHGCTNYNEVIKFLIHICSPIKSATGLNKNNEAEAAWMKEHGFDEVLGNEQGIGTQAFKNLSAAAGGISEGINTLTSAGKSFIDTFNGKDKNNSKLKKVVDSLAKTMQNAYSNVVATTSSGKNNANFTVSFSIMDKIYSNVNITTTGLTKSGIITFPIDWIITGFTFTPSTQFEFDEIEEIPMPLWVNFDLTLETRLSLSNKYIYNLMMKEDERF